MYEKYSIKKGKLDLLSSLRLLDKNIINEKLRNYGLKNINELKDYIIERLASHHLGNSSFGKTKISVLSSSPIFVQLNILQ